MNFELLLQLLLNGVGLGASYSLVALGFALIWSVTGVFHLAHGGVFVLSGYLVYFFQVQLGLPLAPALLLTVLLAAMIGVGIDRVVYRPLIERRSGPLIVIVASLATLTFLLNLSAVLWGTEARQLPPLELFDGIVIGPAYLAGIDILTVILGILLVGATLAFLYLAKTGQAMRAVADNPAMSAVVGVKVASINAAAYALGSALTVAPAAIMGMKEGLSPYSGLFVMLIASSAAIVGGVGSVAGAVLGGVLLAVAQNVGIWHLPSAWQESIAFVILLIFLIVRPRGFFGTLGSRQGL